MAQNITTLLEKDDASGIASTDYLYLVQGSGSNRDRKMTLQQLSDFLGNAEMTSVSFQKVIDGKTYEVTVDGEGLVIKQLVQHGNSQTVLSLTKDGISTSGMVLTQNSLVFKDDGTIKTTVNNESITFTAAAGQNPVTTYKLIIDGHSITLGHMYNGNLNTDWTIDQRGLIFDDAIVNGKTVFGNKVSGNEVIANNNLTVATNALVASSGSVVVGNALTVNDSATFNSTASFEGAVTAKENVTIGTNASNKTLTVEGTTSVTGNFTASSSNFSVDTSGVLSKLNVAVGTSGVSKDLTVHGQTKTTALVTPLTNEGVTTVPTKVFSFYAFPPTASQDVTWDLTDLDTTIWQVGTRVVFYNGNTTYKLTLRTEYNSTMSTYEEYTLNPSRCCEFILIAIANSRLVWRPISWNT